jgi:hypothetical protein
VSNVFKFYGEDVNISSETWIKMQASDRITLAVANTSIVIENGAVTINGNLSISGTLTASSIVEG